jgi:poly-gamma-glutamate synthase PgsB/CapB
MVVISTLIILLLILIGFGLIESYFHRLALAQLPIRIHVNGSRGKSSVTRLIAAGLRSSGMRTIAKTTGTAPRVIDESGKDRVIHRLRSASIGEQVRLLRNFSKQKPQAVVIECMAVNPQYQWISEHKMINSTISVMTNVRPDHIDEMGLTLKDNAMSLSNTIPFNGKMVTVAGDVNLDGCINEVDTEINKIFRNVASKRNSEFHESSINDVPEDVMGKFKYLEHVDNVSLALKVCELSGVDTEQALKGMVNVQPDLGATVIWELQFSNIKVHFVNLLAANDPESTFKIYNQLKSQIENSPVCIFLNTRNDRRYRTNQLLDLIFNYIQPEALIVRGKNLPTQFNTYKKKFPKIKISELSYHIGIKEMVNEFKKLNGFYVIGIGNMVGWGEEFIQRLKEYRI